MSEFSIQRFKSQTFLPLFFISVLVHAIVVSAIQFTQPPKAEEELIEIEFFELKPVPPPPKLEVAKPKTSPSPPKTEAKPPQPEKPAVPKPVLSIDNKVSELKQLPSASSGAKVTSSTLKVPKFEEEKTDAVTPVTAIEAPNKVKWSKLIKPSQQRAEKNVEDGVEIQDIVKQDITREASSLNKTTEVTAGNGLNSNSSRSVNSSPNIQRNVTIEGEISNRGIIFRPPQPELGLDRDVTIALKFTVLPNGEVDKVFPYRKADPELERLAIEMLQKFRFEPLFGSSQVQNGIIHFNLNRKAAN